MRFFKSYDFGLVGGWLVAFTGMRELSMETAPRESLYTTFLFFFEYTPSPPFFRWSPQTSKKGNIGLKNLDDPPNPTPTPCSQFAAPLYYPQPSSLYSA